MLKYDYIIKRDEGDEIREYRPGFIPKELADVVYIEGQNSSGKSTLLNMIALGFFGLKLKEDELNPALRERLKNLLYSEHQDIVFNIEIQNNKLSTVLKASKSDFSSKQFQVRKRVGDNERPIGPEQFHKEYKLIYDVPSNPLERLAQLLKEIRNSQLLRGNQVTMLNHFIKKTIDEVRDSKDPKQLAELIETLKTQQKDCGQHIKELDRKYEFLKEFEKFYFTKTYLEYKELLNKVKEEINKIEKSKQEIKKEEKEHAKDEDTLLKRIAENAQDVKNCYHKATAYLKSLVPDSERHHFRIWIDTSINDEINQPEIFQSLRQEAEYFINLLPDILDAYDEDKIQEANFLKALLRVLNDYSHSKITIPETNKNVAEFIKILEEKVHHFEEIITKNQNICDCIEHVKKMKECLEQAIQLTTEYKSKVKEHGKAIENVKVASAATEYKQLKKQKYFLEEKLTFFAKELVKINLDELEAENILSTLRYTKEFDTYEGYTENQLFDKLNYIKKEIHEDQQKKDRFERIIFTTQLEIDRIKKKKPHKYQRYLPKLEKYFKLVQNLEKKLTVTFDSYIKMMINKEKDIASFSDEEKKYSHKIAEFLAEKIRYIRHIDQNFLIKKIDVINEELLTEENKTIKFKDIGTGQSQGAYLIGLLSMTDNRKIIALIDEVAMMDSLTLEPIFVKLKELYKEKKLLLGIIVQKSDQNKVKQLA